MIDTHAHIYTKEFDADRNEMIDRAKQAGITQICMPAIDAQSHQKLLDVAANHPGYCLPMLGLHPCSVQKNYKDELKVVDALLKDYKVVGIGEAGIDLYWDKTTFNLQTEALKAQAEIALSLKLPLILHTRNATQQTIDIIKPFANRGLTGIFHCFGGTAAEANEITGMGFLVGIGGVVTYKNGGLNNVLPHLKMGDIVLETDAPYLSPAPHRGKRNEPAYLPHIVQKIAAYMQQEEAVVKSTSTQNARKLFLINES